MPTYTVQDSQTNKTITFEWGGENPPTDMDMEEIFNSVKDFAPTAPRTKQEGQLKIDALNPNPQFSDEPDYGGLPVGNPTKSFGKEAFGIANVIDKPRQAVLESTPVDETDPYWTTKKGGLSAYDVAGGVAKRLLGMGGSTEALPYDIAEPEDFKNIADTIGKVGLDLGTMHPYYRGMSKILSGIEEIGTGIKSYDNKIFQEVEKGITKGIRDTQRGKMGWPDREKYLNRATQAVRDIIDNKGSLRLKNEHGYDVIGELPTNKKVALKQFSQAINQGLERTWKEGEALVAKATGANVVIDLNKVADNLENMMTKGLKLGDKQAYNYVSGLVNEFRNSGQISADEAVEMVKRINARIKGEINSGKKGFTMSGRGYIDYEANVLIREELDAMIENLTGKRYQPIRDKYASYKAIEKDTINRVIVDARKNPYGIMDLMDVFSGYHAVRGLLTLDAPTMTAAFSSKLISTGQKLINDPNRTIRKMFLRTEELMNKQKGLVK